METKKPGSFRPGKTERDHKSGNWMQNKHNKQARADWRNQSQAKRDANYPNFPALTCNGKRNRQKKA